MLSNGLLQIGVFRLIVFIKFINVTKQLLITKLVGDEPEKLADDQEKVTAEAGKVADESEQLAPNQKSRH